MRPNLPPRTFWVPLRSRHLFQIRRLRDNDCLVVHRGRSHGGLKQGNGARLGSVPERLQETGNIADTPEHSLRDISYVVIPHPRRATLDEEQGETVCRLTR